MNTTDRNTKDKKKGEHEDIFENGDEAKDTEMPKMRLKWKYNSQDEGTCGKTWKPCEVLF